MGVTFGGGKPVQLMIAGPSASQGLPLGVPEFEAQVVKCYYCTACQAIHQENEPEFRAHRKHADARGVWERTCLTVNRKGA